MTSSQDDATDRCGGAQVLKSDWSANGVESAVARLWIEHGGDHHGPRVETVTMPMSKLMGFVAALKASPAPPEGGLMLGGSSVAQSGSSPAQEPAKSESGEGH